MVVAAVTGLFIGAAFASGRKVMKGGIDAPEAIELRAESVKRLDHAGVSPQAILFNDMVLRLGSRRSAYSCDGGGHPGDTPGTGARWPQSGRSAGATAAWAGRCSSMRLSSRRIR